MRHRRRQAEKGRYDRRLMGHDYAGRLVRAADETRAAALDALVISPSADLVYLIGYHAPPLERLTALVLRPGRDPVLVLPRLEHPRAAQSPAGTLVEFAPWRDEEDSSQAIARMLPGSGTFGVSDQMWAIHVLGLQAEAPEAKIVPASHVLSRLRARKDQSEIDLLRRAAQSADETFAEIVREGLSGRQERAVARSLRQHLVETGHDEALFWIVGSGPNGASPHHEPGDRAVRPGDPVVLDFGGRRAGYCSDMTRTVSVGEPQTEVRDVHEIVARAQEAAFRTVKAGVPAEEVDRAARQVIDDAGYGDAFIHRTGHGIGLEEHEPPYIVRGNTQPLEAGMTFSIEPGIYLAGRFGVRIEDIVAVTENGADRLNNAPRELTVVG
jgi:Xaa-Pro aminopeptidase